MNAALRQELRPATHRHGLESLHTPRSCLVGRRARRDVRSVSLLWSTYCESVVPPLYHLCAPRPLLHLLQPHNRPPTTTFSEFNLWITTSAPPTNNTYSIPPATSQYTHSPCNTLKSPAWFMPATGPRNRATQPPRAQVPHPPFLLRPCH